ncbi:MAG: hypothetical protein ACRDYD_09485 [Acidimicrobiales bacterium]
MAARTGAPLPRRPIWRRPALIAWCVGANVTEAILLLATNLPSGLGLAVQANAPAPFGVFHDLRWLIVYHDSWAGFGLEAVALLVARGALTAVTLAAAWPDDVRRPSLGSLMVRGMVFTAAAAVLLVPWTILLFGMAVVSVSWFFLAAVPPVLVVAVLSHHGVVGRDWWRHAPPLRSLAWVLATFAVSSAAAGLASGSGDGTGVLVAAAAGLFDAWAWERMVRAVALKAAGPRRLAPVAPAGLASLLSLAVGGTAIGFAVSTPAPASAAPAPLAPSGPALLVAAGYGSQWDGRGGPPLPGRYREWRFSYRGLGPEGPLPYGSAETDQPLAVLARRMAAQVDALHSRTGQPVDLVAESEGTMVVEAYLAGAAHPPVRDVVLVSPILRPARVYFPPGGKPGWGVAGGTALAGLGEAVGPLAPDQLSARGPLLRSLLQDAPRLVAAVRCPPPGVSLFAVLPLADALAAPGPDDLGIPSVVVPAFHGGLLGDAEVQQVIGAVLAGHPPSEGALWAALEKAVRSSASAWQVPALDHALDPTWSQAGKPTCPAAPLGTLAAAP